MSWTKMFLRLMTLMTYGVTFDEAVATVTDTTPDVTRREVYCAAVAARAHLAREGG